MNKTKPAIIVAGDIALDWYLLRTAEKDTGSNWELVQGTKLISHH